MNILKRRQTICCQFIQLVSLKKKNITQLFFQTSIILFSAKLDNEDIPIPSKLEEIDPTQIASELEFEFKQSFVTLVSVDVEEYAKTHFNKAIKKTLTIPEWLNKEAMSKKINFSQVLQEALIAKLHSM